MRNYFVPLVIATALGIAAILTKKAQAQNTSPQSLDKTSAPVAVEAKNNGQETSPSFLTEIPEGYRDWRLIAVSRLTTAKGSQLRGMLANDLAIKAYRERKFPFPDGAMIAALHWNEVSSQENDKVLADGFPGAGIRSFVPGSVVNMQFMVKDSKKYAATGGWGFGDLNSGKSGHAALMETCFPCHEPAKHRDFVFTRYAR